jgi:hypothetical protein
MNRILALALLVLIPLPPQVHAQTAVEPAGPSRYDISQEVTLNATVSAVLMKPASGMIAGSHLLLATLSGPVDASLGLFGLRGKGALSVPAGQQIEVTGVMKTIRDKQVFVTRTVKVGSEIFMIRTEHGIQISPQTRERLAQKSTGGTL